VDGTAVESSASSRLAVEAKAESGLRIDKRLAASIEDNGSDIAPGIEAGSSEHVHQLFACSAFVVRKRSRKQLRATQLPLRARGKPGLGKIDEERQDSRQIGAGNWRIHAKCCALAHVD